MAVSHRPHINEALAVRLASLRSRQMSEDAFDHSSYNRWEVTELLIREIEAVAVDLGVEMERKNVG